MPVNSNEGTENQHFSAPNTTSHNWTSKEWTTQFLEGKDWELVWPHNSDSYVYVWTRFCTEVPRMVE